LEEGDCHFIRKASTEEEVKRKTMKQQAERLTKRKKQSKTRKDSSETICTYSSRDLKGK
jgi:hypothetical protein